MPPDEPPGLRWVHRGLQKIPDISRSERRQAADQAAKKVPDTNSPLSPPAVLPPRIFLGGLLKYGKTGSPDGQRGSLMTDKVIESITGLAV